MLQTTILIFDVNIQISVFDEYYLSMQSAAGFHHILYSVYLFDDYVFFFRSLELLFAD